MSNATVVNATNSSGLSAGSPITIETGGDVEFVAAGKFTGAGFATIAFAPYVDGKAGAPTLITITSEIPLKRTSALGTGATQFVGWVADASGTWEASGVVIGDSDHEALSDDLGTFPDVARMPTKAVKIGATAKTTEGVPYSWGAAGWGAPPGAWVYVGATLPALGSYIGQLIQVDNSAVPSGRSILRWNGTIWAPPAGELIAAAASSTPGPLALVTPGVTTLTQIWASEVIP